MKRKIIFLMITITMLLSFYWICKKTYISTDIQSHEKKHKTIVCTTMLIADAVKQLVDDNFNIISLMGPGIDPHTYKVKPSDVQQMLHADVILYNGLHLEGKMGEVFGSISKEKEIICVTDGISKSELISAGYENIYDPHVWHDHILWQQVISYISSELSNVFPDYKDMFEQKKNEYDAQLQTLEQYIETQLERLPIQQRFLITAHDAFHYFGKRYHFVVKALQGLSTESDIGIKDINNLVDLILKHNIRAIFLESCIPPRNSMSLQEAVLHRGKEIIIGGELFSDSLSDLQGPAANYIDMMQYNIKTIIDALLMIQN